MWSCRVFAAFIVTMVAPIVLLRSAHAAPPNKHVVIISIDGFAAYLLDDPKAPIPAIRALARAGASAQSGMKVSNPSVTWPNHTSLVTGVRPEKHGVLANGVLVRSSVNVPVTVDPNRSKMELVRVGTLYDAAHAAGLTTADINWPCTRDADSLDDRFPDAPNAVQHSSSQLREELIAAGLLHDATDASFTANSVVGRDHIWTEAACHVIRARKPNLLLLHLLNCDATHHAEGPQSPPGYTANAYADACVSRVLMAIDDAGIRDATTVFIVADHGFAMTPRAIRPNVLLRQAGLLQVGPTGKTTEARVNVVPEGGIGLVYCNDPGNLAADREAVAKIFAGQEGVAAVLHPEEFAQYGLPHPRAYAQAPNLVIVAADGYGVSAQADGDAFTGTNVEARTALGTHGLLSTTPKMNAICVMAGRGIEPGARIEACENIDIAPTAAQLLGIPFTADGRVLTEALKTD